MARHRNDLKLRHNLYAVSPLNDPLRIRSCFDVRPMNQPFRAEVCRIFLGIGHIIFMREEDVREAPLSFEGLEKMFEISRGIDEPVAIRTFDEKAICTERLLRI